MCVCVLCVSGGADLRGGEGGRGECVCVCVCVFDDLIQCQLALCWQNK